MKKAVEGDEWKNLLKISKERMEKARKGTRRYIKDKERRK